MVELGGSYSPSAVSTAVSCASPTAGNFESGPSTAAALRSSEATASPAMAASAECTSYSPAGNDTLTESSAQLSSGEADQVSQSTEECRPINAAASTPVEPSGGTVPLHALAVLGHPLPEAQVPMEVMGYPTSRQIYHTPQNSTRQQWQSYWQQKQYYVTDALVLSVMCVLLVVFTFCILAMALTQRQWTHTADACWFDERTVTSRFYPYVIQNPQGAQMTMGWLGYSYCDDTDSLFMQCRNRFTNLHLSTALQIVGILAFVSLALTAIWALGMGLAFLRLLGKDPEDALKLHARYTCYYHPYHGFNWVLPVMTLLLCIPAFELAAWEAIHAQDSHCTYDALVFDPGQIFCIVLLGLIIIVLPMQHCLLSRLADRLSRQGSSQVISAVP